MSVSAGLLAQASPAGVEVGPRVAAHLLRRIGYGPRPGDVAQVLRQGLERYVLEQIEAPADPDLDQRLRRLTTLGYPIGQVVALYNADNRSIGPILDEFYLAKLIRAVHGRNQLQEVLTDFWFNHFNVFIGDGFDRYATPAYERDAIRPHVLGRFRDLLGATAAHPAMLFYLDNYLSSVARTDPRTGRLIQGLNENYGRELLELHTVGVDAGYTQEHVFDAARCFTGWTIDQRQGVFVYRAQNHDTAAKSVFGLGVPSGGGREDGERLLDYLAEHPATARFVSRKLLQRLVTDDPSDALVGRIAATFESTGGDIAAVVRAIVSTAEFWAEAFGPGRPRTPLEYVAGALRAAGAEVNQGRAATAALAAMGMPLYGCLPPTGYSNRAADWVNPSSHLARMNFGLDLAVGAVNGVAVRPARAGGARRRGRGGCAGPLRRVVARDLRRRPLAGDPRGGGAGGDGRQRQRGGAGGGPRARQPRDAGEVGNGFLGRVASRVPARGRPGRGRHRIPAVVAAGAHRAGRGRRRQGARPGLPARRVRRAQPLRALR